MLLTAARFFGPQLLLTGLVANKLMVRAACCTALHTLHIYTYRATDLLEGPVCNRYMFGPQLLLTCLVANKLTVSGARLAAAARLQ
jgi:hypothetical protein